MLAPHILLSIAQVATVGPVAKAATAAGPMIAAAAAGSADPAFTGNVASSAALLLSIAVAIFSIATFFRRQPPIGEQMHKEFATKEELKVAEKAAADSVRRIHQRIEQVLHDVNRNHADSEAARGRLFGQVEGIIDSLAEMKQDIRDSRS